MGVRGLIWAVGLAILGTALVPATAGAVKLGTPHFTYDDVDAGVTCGSPGANCIVMQKKLPGATLKAPFGGTIRKFRFAVPSNTQSRQLIVLRKNGNGSFELVRGSALKTPPAVGAYTYKTKLHVRRGDRIGLYATGTPGSSISIANTPGATRVTFNPPPLIGGSGTPGSPIDGEVLFNATLKR